MTLVLVLAGCGIRAGSVASPAVTATATAPLPSGSPAPKVAAVGTITGALGYPSNFIPPLSVYAVSVADKGIFFSVSTLRYPQPTSSGAPGYTISGVAPGTYHVFAYRDDNDPNNHGGPGLYSQYLIKCVPPPATAVCDDHSLIAVTVNTGETVWNIDVKDWYYDAQTTTYPPRP